MLWPFRWRVVMTVGILLIIRIKIDKFFYLLRFFCRFLFFFVFFLWLLLSIILFIFMLVFWRFWLTNTVRILIILLILLWNRRTIKFLLHLVLFYTLNLLFIDLDKLIFCQISYVFVITKKSSQICLPMIISMWKMLPASYLHL